MTHAPYTQLLRGVERGLFRSPRSLEKATELQDKRLLRALRCGHVEWSDALGRAVLTTTGAQQLPVLPKDWIWRALCYAVLDPDAYDVEILGKLEPSERKRRCKSAHYIASCQHTTLLQIHGDVPTDVITACLFDHAVVTADVRWWRVT